MADLVKKFRSGIQYPIAPSSEDPNIGLMDTVIGTVTPLSHYLL